LLLAELKWSRQYRFTLCGNRLHQFN
jgi:hypothetical protein